VSKIIQSGRRNPGAFISDEIVWLDGSDAWGLCEGSASWFITGLHFFPVPGAVVITVSKL